MLKNSMKFKKLRKTNLQNFSEKEISKLSSKIRSQQKLEAQALSRYAKEDYKFENILRFVPGWIIFIFYIENIYI